ncbi:MAG TPA: DoxX family membrane protein, partial [Bacteroidales bacterium]|nr:DoxX family membrane protein [Bacteroidales bacterium]
MKKENILPGLFTITRMLLGWHLFYEGLVKVTNPDWTSAPYLANSRWIFSGIFNHMASSPGIMQVVDFMNAWGLTLAGLALLLGVFIRISCLGGSLLLLFYYLAYPPIPGFMFGVPNEGAYLWVNKNLIEMTVLAAMAFIPGN